MIQQHEFSKSVFSRLPARAACLGLCVLLGLPALSAEARVREYGSSSQRFTLDVPDGWQERRVDDSVQLVSPDRKTVLSARLFPREGKRAEALVRKAARDLNVSGIHQKDENTWVFYVSSENVRIRNSLHTLKDNVVLISVSGPMEAAAPVIASLKAKD